MADKISTLEVKVDLTCGKCRKEIRKALCKLQEKECIKKINYDDKSNTVTIAGPFDPNRVSKKLSCMAGKWIKGIKTVNEEEEKKKKAEEEKKKKEEEEKKKKAEEEKKKKEEEEKKKKAEEEKKKKEEEEKKKAEEEKKRKEEEEKKKKAEEEKKRKEEEEKKKKKKAEQAIVLGVPHWLAVPCCQKPYVVSFHGGCRCCTCGRVGGADPVGPSMFYPQRYPPPPMPCKFVCDDDTSATCSIM